MVRIVLGFAVKQRGQELKQETTSLIPVVLDIEAIMKNSSRVKQLLAMCHTSKNIKTYFSFLKWIKILNKWRIKQSK